MSHVVLARFAALAALLAWLPACAPAEIAQVTVWKTPTCGCCGKWVTHLRDAGFAVEVHDLEDLGEVKSAHGVPESLSSCHTAVVEGYVVEGHVPAGDVRRLLQERPAVTGLAVPGMPVGSPGMEGPDPEPYRVLAFDSSGRTRIFSAHP